MDSIEPKLSEPALQVVSRNPDGTFPKGVSGNPKGKEKGKTMKEFVREYLLALSDEEKKAWLKGLSKETIWKMSEGMPHQTQDLTSGDKPLPAPFYGGKSLGEET